MRTKGKNEINMTEGSLAFKILLFAIPLAASSILQLLFNAADVIVVGRYAGSEALAAVGSNTALITLITNIFIGLSIGSNVLVAKYIGAGREREIKQTVHTSVAMAIWGGIFLLGFGVVFSRFFLVLMSSPTEVIGLATIYLRIYFLSMPALLMYNFGAAILRAVGDTKRPLYYLTVAGVINVVLNLIFVIVFNMGVAGVAIATVVSQYVSAFLVYRCLAKSDSAIKIIASEIRFHRDRTIEIIRIGVPAGVQGMMFSISNVLIQSSINSFGAQCVAGNAAAANLEGFVYMSMNAFYQACISFTGQNFGARKPDRIIKTLCWCVFYGMLTGIVLGVPAYLYSRTLIGIYASDAAVIEYGILRMKYISAIYFLCAFMDVPVGTLRGMGYAVVPAIVSLLGVCVFRVIWIFTIFRMFHRPEILYISYAITWILTGVIHYICIYISFKNLKRQRFFV